MFLTVMKRQPFSLCFVVILCYVEKKNLASTMLPPLKNWFKAEGESFGAGSFFSE